MTRLDLLVDSLPEERLPPGKAYLASAMPDTLAKADTLPFNTLCVQGCRDNIIALISEPIEHHGLMVIFTPGSLIPVGNPRLDTFREYLLVQDKAKEGEKEVVIHEFYLSGLASMGQPGPCSVCMAVPLGAVLDKLTLPVGVPAHMHPNVTRQLQRYGYLKQLIDVTECLGVQSLTDFMRDTQVQFSHAGELHRLEEVNKGSV